MSVGGKLAEVSVAPKILAVDLETVFRLAEAQNHQVSLARARVQEACAEKALASNTWIPNLYIGPAYFRHEGGISNEDGTLTHSSFSSLFAGMELNGLLDFRESVFRRVNAERQLRQQRGELRRITNETLLDAAGTYIDLLTARTAEALVLSKQQDLDDLLKQAQRLMVTEPGAEIEVSRIRASIKGRQQLLLELREQADRASIRLAYLLGLDPAVTLLPADEHVMPLELVNASPPVGDLVAQALATGPGIREMEELLGLVHESMERAQGLGRFLPALEMHMAEGGFGTGPGDRQDWDNRWDFGIKARWNLTDLLTARDRQRVIQAKADQAHFAYEDLRGKLTAGVRESREVILSGKEKIRIGAEHIQDAERAYELSKERLRLNVKGNSYSEVLLGLQTLSLAQVNHLQALRAYDKAQLRLLLLLGMRPGRDADCPIATGTGQ
jgi:outer membrane protein TolC